MNIKPALIPQPLPQVWAKGSRYQSPSPRLGRKGADIKVPLPDLGEGFRVRARIYTGSQFLVGTINYEPQTPMTDFWDNVLSFAQTTTARVGTKLLQDFGQVQASQKADGSLVTQADKWADEQIRQAVFDTFPSHDVLSEESEHTFFGAEWCWVIDPIDGTTNFTRGIPIWGISLGLLYQGTPVFGYVHFPPLNQSFHGFWYGNRDKESSIKNPIGAFLNNRPIHTSPDSPSLNHFFCLCARSTSVLQKPFPCKIRMLGVTTYNFLAAASGATLGGVESTPKVWDIAAVWTILQAAGGVWVPLSSQPVFPLEEGENYGDRSFPTLVVSRPELVPVFLPLVEFLKK